MYKGKAMNNRWCIIASPRTGSNYLEEMIQGNIIKQGNFTVKLGEMLHRTIWAYSDSEGSFFRLESDYNSTIRKNFRDDLFKKLEDDPSMGASLRLFIQTHHMPEMDYKEFVKKLETLNFKFIHLTRNIFDSIISLSMAQNTGLWHKRIGPNNNIVIDGNQDYAKNPTTIHIPITVFGSNYIDMKYHDYYNTDLLKDLDYVSVKYENILEDCKSNSISVVEKTSIKKLYQTDYRDLIANYSELEEFFKHIKNG